MDDTPLELRIRRAIAQDHADNGMVFINLPEALDALGLVLAEAMAHLNERAAEEYIRRLWACRKHWQATPQVLEQLEVEGSA